MTRATNETTDETKADDAVRELQLKLAAALATIEKLAAENKDLVAYIESMRRRLFGRSSEKLDPNQLSLFAEQITNVAAAAQASTAETPVEKTAKSEKRAGHGRKPFAPHLSRNVIVHDVPEAERTCKCGTAMVAIGEDVCERGHVIPAKVVVNRHVVKKYACPNGHGVKSASDLAAGFIEKTKFETSVYAHIAVSKFGDHLPLNRQEEIFKRYGVEISKSTMSDMMLAMHEKAAAKIVARMREEVLASRVLQADETPITVLIEGEHGQKTGYVWVWRGDEKIVFEFRMSRGRDGPIAFLGKWRGVLQVDGYSGYDQVVLLNAIIRAACWAHVRRKFFEALETGFADAASVIAKIARLYRIEQAIRVRVAGQSLAKDDAISLRADVRGRLSRIVVDRIEKEVAALRANPATTPKSPIGKAVEYAKNQWPALLVFLKDGEVEIDNNAVERAIRPIAVGRKNWLFAGSPRGAEAAASLYSLIQACRALGINPEAYLADVLEHVSPNADFSMLTPWAWAARAKETRQPT